MSNHSDKPGDSPTPEALRRVLEGQLIGATGQHPEPRLTESDEGSIQFAVGVKDGEVCLDFGTPVVWLGMKPDDAFGLAEVLIAHARKAAKGTNLIAALKAMEQEG